MRPRPSGTSRRVLAVPRERAGDRLDRFLARELPATAERARALVTEGRVRIRGKTCSPVRKLFGGEAIEVLLPAPRAALPTADEPVLPVLADGPGFLVVDKPAGLPVLPAGPRSPSAVGAASALGAFDVDGRALPGLPHRIDRDTTGCLLLARTDAALAALLAAFQDGRVEKEYLALVAGAPPDEGRLDTPYARSPDDPRRFTTRVPSARRARLSFRVERRLHGGALLRVRLETGRTHQIRVQLAEAGWPILGDAVYGRPSPLIGRQGLHAWRLAFPRPSDGDRVEAEAPVPADLAAAVEVMARPGP
ncbi:MAG TPA: RluA family pseudouridine synthase [Anaeromyxobacteraceae bacterium]|nr:RluA family pseudouridine synthase [Anaeromyxobacteraceae bacterium]